MRILPAAPAPTFVVPITFQHTGPIWEAYLVRGPLLAVLSTGLGRSRPTATPDFKMALRLRTTARTLLTPRSPSCSQRGLSRPDSTRAAIGLPVRLRTAPWHFL